MSNTISSTSVKQEPIQPQSGLKYQFSEFVLCTEQNLLMRGDQIVPLNLKTVQCLILLVTNANKVVLRESFFSYVWDSSFVDGGVLNVNISCLRKILGKNKIKTYSGRGYSLKEQVKVIFVDDKPVSNQARSADKNPETKVRTRKSFLQRIKTVLTVLFL